MSEPTQSLNLRIKIVLIINIIIAAFIISRLFYLQVIKYEEIASQSEGSRTGETVLTAKRGNILMQDYHSKELTHLATNTTFGRIIADPTLIQNPNIIVDELTPILFNLEKHQEENINFLEDIKKSATKEQIEEAGISLTPKSDKQLLSEFKQDFLESISKKKREKIILTDKNFPQSLAEQVSSFNLSGIEASENLLIAYPGQISNKEETAKVLSSILDTSTKRLATLLEGKNRYIVLKRKIDTDIRESINQIKEEHKTETENFLGIKIEDVNYRYYPEQNFASQIIGFMNHKDGRYGIESKYNELLKGKDGTFLAKKDAFGKQLTVQDSIIQPPVDGKDFILTIDGAIQLKTEFLLSEAVKNTNADAGTVIIMEPKTGEIITMAHYPSFNPNEYAKVYEKETIVLTEEEEEKVITLTEGGNEVTYLIINKDTDDKLRVFKEEDQFGNEIYKKFKNKYGPAVYRNRSVMDIYEPGSVFKVIAMASAIDDNDVTPSTIYNDTGPVEVDEFEIKNSEDKYYGRVNMTNVLERSLNTGMAFVAQRMGRHLFFNYIKKFGFGEPTYIEFEGEHSGLLKTGKRWADSELVTHSFGQGISVTPIQMLTAFSVIANKGLLMEPHIISSNIDHNGNKYKTDPKIIRRVISEETANKLVAMLTSAVENGVAGNASVPSHLIAGKTGTSQTYKWGKPLSGAGTTITSFAGFAPVSDPKFVVLVKLDHPRSSEWGAKTAAPLFSQIASFLLTYYNIPPDKK